MSAFAVFCATDGSLTFYNRDTVPAVGSTFEGKIASNVYTGFETECYNSESSIPWYNEMANIVSVSFVDKIVPKYTGRWFGGATAMTSFDGTNLNTSNTIEIDAMFYGCSALTDLNISGFDTGNVTTMRLMFAYCSSLTSLDLSNFNTINTSNMYGMFFACTQLSTIYVSDLWNISTSTDSSSMFYKCTSLVGAVPFDSTKTDVTMANYETGYFTYKFYADYFKDRFVLDGSELNAIAESVRKLTGSKDGMTTAQIVVALEGKKTEVEQLEAQITELNESWAGTLTFSGTYATSTYYTAAGCSLAVDKQKGMAFITIQGGTSTSYENIYFAATSLPSGVTLLTPAGGTTGSNFGTGGSTKCYYTAVLTGITGQINVEVSMTLRANTSYDAVQCALTVTYAPKIVVPVDPITFTFFGNTYTAERGMTWEEFVNSSLNTNSTFFIGDDNSIRAPGMKVSDVTKDDVIIAGYKYSNEPL